MTIEKFLDVLEEKNFRPNGFGRDYACMTLFKGDLNISFIFYSNNNGSYRENITCEIWNNDILIFETVINVSSVIFDCGKMTDTEKNISIHF